MCNNQCVQFDDEKKVLTIMETKEEISYDTIEKVTVLNEEAKFKGTSEPFTHQVLGGTTFYSMLGEPSLYVGLKIALKDGTSKAAYISNRKTGINTDIYQEDHKEAEAIKSKIDQVIV